jgi:hypothetical protein
MPQDTTPEKTADGGLPSTELLAVVVAGGRGYRITGADEAWLDTLPIREVVSGGASGADAGGESWARKRGIPIKRFLADWNTHGRAAGPIRNRQMAEYAEGVVLFPGGRGTDSMRREAERRGLQIFSANANMEAPNA